MFLYKINFYWESFDLFLLCHFFTITKCKTYKGITDQIISCNPESIDEDVCKTVHLRPSERRWVFSYYHLFLLLDNHNNRFIKIDNRFRKLKFLVNSHDPWRFPGRPVLKLLETWSGDVQWYVSKLLEFSKRNHIEVWSCNLWKTPIIYSRSMCFVYQKVLKEGLRGPWLFIFFWIKVLYRILFDRLDVGHPVYTGSYRTLHRVMCNHLKEFCHTPKNT